jgi:hypothetical protein
MGLLPFTRRGGTSLRALGDLRRCSRALYPYDAYPPCFEFVDYTDLHYRADDELVYEVGRRSVTGDTDRFTMLLRKP